MMASKSRRPRRRDGGLSTFDPSIQALNLAKDTCGIPPAQAVLGSASAVLTIIKDTIANDQDYVELGLACGEVCQALDRGLNARKLDELSQSVLGAIRQLTTTVDEIQRKVIKQGKRNVASRVFRAKGDKDKIAAWREDLARLLYVFNSELAINSHTDTHQNTLTGQEGASGQNHSAQASIPLGESPPPAPRACFGRDEFIENVVGLAESLEPIALIGAGGIGKTSIALTVLGHNRIIKQFGDDRRFIRCDQFPTSRAHFLARLSTVIGAGVQNPTDLTSLRPFLSSKKMLLILDNAESILDPQGTNAQEISSVVDELCQFKTVCLLITSRISAVPKNCTRPEIPMLSMEAACDIFYSNYGNGKRSSIVNDLLLRLDFHPLSIMLLAVTASHHAWDHNRLVKEWDTQRAQVLQTVYNESLAVTIEVSLGSPTFRSLGPNARDLLGVIAFFPQGIDENNIDWLFPTISNRKNTFHELCVLSLIYRTNGFFTMLAPIRDYLGPQDPQSTSLLCATRDRYFSRLSVEVDPDNASFGEARWILSEDVNIEHLLDVFTSINPGRSDIWDVCYHFIEHLRWHKPRETLLGLKIEALPDDHHYKPKCLLGLSQLFAQVGNRPGQKALLTHALELGRQRGDGRQIAETLQCLSDANRQLGLLKEGIQQAEEASEFFKRIGDTGERVQSLINLILLLKDDEQLDAAEDAAFRTINLVPDKGQEFTICQIHRLIGSIYQSKGEKQKAVHHFKTALEIASPFNWLSLPSYIHYELAELFCDENELDDANTHAKQAKSHANDTYQLGEATDLQARVWYLQGRLEDAKSEALHALEIFEKLEAEDDMETCRELLQSIEKDMKSWSTSFKSAKSAAKRLGKYLSRR